MIGLRVFLVIAVAVGLAGRTSPAAACAIGKIAELPVTMVGLWPTVPAKINGADAAFLADSGAFYSFITDAKATQFDLSRRALWFGASVTGVGGTAAISAATVKTLTLADTPIPRIDFLIISGTDLGHGLAGALGQNVLGLADVEYDLANGVIRLMEARDCQNRDLAYWAQGAPGVGVVEMDPDAKARRRTSGTALVNGVKIRVIFDSGASTSVLDLKAARRAGLATDGPGVIAAGEVPGGIGQRWMTTWVTPVASFKVGGEEVRNTRLRIGDLSRVDIDMLIGGDFFLSHRIYVANKQGRIYFTYNGGPVFNLTTASARASAPPLGAPASSLDAASLSRRGQASASRGDLAGALADLDRACQLAPDEARYLFERGVIRSRMGDAKAALADYDKAVALKGDDVPTLLARAYLRLAIGDKVGAARDLAAADVAAPREADERMAIAAGYDRAGRFDQAIAQYDLWLATHPGDNRRIEALNGRCWTRAMANTDLDKARKDCDAAVRLNPKFAPVRDSRGLVELRLGEFDVAIADYDAALALQPKNAWSLYGRGVAEMRQGRPAEGAADMAAATALAPKLAVEAKAHGIAP